MRALLVFALSLLAVTSSVDAQEREKLGVGRLFNNDYFGDGRDRWRTGSYVVSYLSGRKPYDGIPQNFGDILEFRLRGELIAPSSRTARDRPFVGALSVGAHTYFGQGPMHYQLGADLVAIGPQTNVGAFQEAFHDLFGLRQPAMKPDIGNDTFVTGTAAATYVYRTSDHLSLRPFAEMTVGGEDLVRLGGDVLIGPVAQDDLLLRDVVTGQLYRGTENGPSGLTYLLGADVAAVSYSLLLPKDEGYVVSDRRTRARAGVMWQPANDVSFFYGLTYLGPEFEGQSEGQLSGSLRLNFNF